MHWSYIFLALIHRYHVMKKLPWLQLFQCWDWQSCIYLCTSMNKSSVQGARWIHKCITDLSLFYATLDNLTVSLYSPNGRQVACHYGCTRRLWVTSKIGVQSALQIFQNALTCRYTRFIFISANRKGNDKSQSMTLSHHPQTTLQPPD